MASIRLVFWNLIHEVEELRPSPLEGLYMLTGHHALGWFHGLAKVEDLAPLLFPLQKEDA